MRETNPRQNRRRGGSERHGDMGAGRDVKAGV